MGKRTEILGLTVMYLLLYATGQHTGLAQWP